MNKSILKRILSFGVIVSLISTLTFTVNSYDSAGDTIYVSPAGSDENDGTYANPVKSIAKAKELVREIKAITNGNKSITVYLRGGDYYINDEIIFGKDDSGTEDCPIIWKNYNDEKVTLIGGDRISGAEFTEVTDSSLLSEIEYKSTQSRIYSIPLSKIGVSDAGYPVLLGSESYNLNLMSDLVDLGRRVDIPDCGSIEVFLDDEIMTNARYPDNGYLNIKDVVSSDEITTNSFAFTVDDSRISKWTLPSKENPILVCGFWRFEWAEQTIPVTQINNDQITAEWQSVYGAQAGMPFYFYNLFEEMNNPGEYYIDRENNLLYINAEGDLSNKSITITSCDKSLIYLHNADYVYFSGIDVFGARKNAFSIGSDSTGCRISDSEISYTGKYAIEVYGKDNVISECYFHDVNGGVLLSGGDSKTLTPGNNKVRNCEFERFSRLDQTYTPAVKLINCVENIVEFNEIHDAPHNAIMIAGQKNKIYYNNIYDVLKNTDDAGAIYGGLSWIDRGNEVKYNYIHDIVNNGTGTDGGIYGVFLDGGLCDTVVEGNIFANLTGVKNQCIFVSSGRYNVIKNNYGINATNMLQMYPNVGQNELEKHHIRELSYGIHDNDIWREEFPELFDTLSELESGTLFNQDGKISPLYNTFENNVCYNTKYFQGTSDTWLSSDWENENYISDSDSCFVSISTTNPDYTLKDNSDVITKLASNGFYKLKFHCMGIQGNEACLSDGFNYEYYGNKCLVSLCHESDKGEDAVLAYAIYKRENDKNTYTLTDTLTESIGFSERIHNTKEFDVDTSETLKGFLWNKNSLRPLCKSSPSEELMHLTLEGNGIEPISLQATRTNYTVYVPVTYNNAENKYSFVPYDVIAVPKSENYKCNVTKTSGDPGKITIDVCDTSNNVLDTYSIFLKPKGENLLLNGGFEKAENNTITDWHIILGTDLLNCQSQDRAFGQKSCIQDLYYTKMPYQPIMLDKDKVYIASYFLKGIEGTDYAKLGAYHWIESITKDALDVKSIYRGNDRVQNIVHSDFYNAGCKFSDVNNWQNVLTVFSPSQRDTSVYFGYLSWLDTDAKCLVDNMYLGELVATEIVVKDEQEKTEITSPNGQIRLNAKILNQLGTNAGFENAEFTWYSDSKYITVENGAVSISPDASDGTYYVYAASNITVNGIGLILGRYKITLD